MNVRNLILGTMLSVLFAGCQHGARNDTYMELMGAQRRALEDRIYDLEFDSEEMEEERKQASRSQHFTTKCCRGPENWMSFWLGQSYSTFLIKWGFAEMGI